MEVVGVGIDIVDLHVFSDVIQNSPKVINRICTDNENTKNVSSLGGIFAAKEALQKSLANLAAIPLADIKVIRSSKRPRICLSGAYSHFNESLKIELSISHHGNYVVAIVLALKNEDLQNHGIK